jgi:GT2 family glycosyltransferase
MTGVYLGVPFTKPFEAEFIDSLLFTKTPGEMIWGRLGYLAVDVARQAICQKFLEHPSKPEWLLFVDNDAVWHAGSVLRLISRDLPIVTAGIYKRKLPPYPTIGKYVGKNNVGERVFSFADTTQAILKYAAKRGIGEGTLNALCLEDPTDDDLMEVDGCGMHFCLIRRDVLQAMSPPYFRTNSGGAGEDFYFCSRAKDAGFPIYFDMSVHTGHLIGPQADVGIRELIAFSKYVVSITEEKPEELNMEVGKW